MNPDGENSSVVPRDTPFSLNTVIYLESDIDLNLDDGSGCIIAQRRKNREDSKGTL